MQHKHNSKASSQPEYLMQRQLEARLNQSYNKLLLALNINMLAEINTKILAPVNSNTNGPQS